MPVSRLLRGRRRWPILIVLSLVALTLIAMALPPLRHGVLKSAGWALVAQDGLAHADVIVISVDADGAGVLEAADLVHAGVASRVALFPDPPDAIDREFIRRGVAYYNSAAVSTIQLHAMGITAVESIPWTVTGTENEGIVMKRWCTQAGLRSVIFISTSDHSRRSRRVLDRALRDSGIQIAIRYSHYSDFDPEGWWRTRGGIRTEIVESQKLLLDVLRHPFS